MAIAQHIYVLLTLLPSGWSFDHSFLVFFSRSIKSVKGQISPTFIKALNLEKHETVVEIDGGGSQTVLQHMGVSTWPGVCKNLTLGFLLDFFFPIVNSTHF